MCRWNARRLLQQLQGPDAEKAFTERFKTEFKAGVAVKCTKLPGLDMPKPMVKTRFRAKRLHLDVFNSVEEA